MSISNNVQETTAPNGQNARSSQITTATLIVALILVLFLPTGFPNQVGNLKNLTIFITALLLTIYYLIASFRRRQFTLVKSPVTVPLLAFGALTLLATLVNFPTSSHENLLNYTGLFLSFVIIAVLGSTLIKVKNSKLIITSVTALAALVGLLTFLRALSILTPAFSAFNFPHLQLGSPLTVLAFLLVATAGCATMYVKKGRLIRPYNFFLPILILGLISTFIVAFQSYTTSTPLLMSPKLSLQTTINAFSLKSPGLEVTGTEPLTANLGNKIKMWLVGAGGESYGDIYNLYKPQWVLQTSDQDFNFTKGFDLPLTMLPTFGVLVTIAWIWVFVKICQEFKNHQATNSHLFLMPAAAFALQLFIPADPIIIFLQAVLIAFSASYSTQHLVKLNSNSKAGRPLYYLILGIFVGLSASNIIFLVKNYSGLISNKAAINRADQIEGSNAALSRYLKDTHSSVTAAPQIDLIQREAALANLTGAVHQYGQNLGTDADISQSLTSLMSDSVSQAKKATELRPNRALNWTTLGFIYQEMADDHLAFDTSEAYSFAIAAYGRAILLDPFNVNNYLQLGKIHLNLSQSAEALVFFQKAVTIDPESADAHLQLGNVYRQINQKDAAYLEYQKAYSSLDPTDPDYEDNVQLLQKEMNSLDLHASQLPSAPTNLNSILE